MASQPPKNRECAFLKAQNLIVKITSNPWKGQLYNAANIPAGQPTGRKALYIQITRGDLRRLDLFKPPQISRASHNQLPLLRFRTQASTYIPSHLHFSNTHTYDEQYCSSCLPMQIIGNETHTLLHCPHFSPLVQPAIQSFGFNHLQFDRWAWAIYTDIQKVTELCYSDLFFSNLNDNMRRHGFF